MLFPPLLHNDYPMYTENTFYMVANTGHGKYLKKKEQRKQSLWSYSLIRCYKISFLTLQWTFLKEQFCQSLRAWPLRPKSLVSSTDPAENNALVTVCSQYIAALWELFWCLLQPSSLLNSVFLISIIKWIQNF